MSTKDMWCPHGGAYKGMPAAILEKTDRELKHGLSRYTTLSGSDRMRPQYRQWRRLLIREALKRGLIHEDPGGAP